MTDNLKALAEKSLELSEKATPGPWQWDDREPKTLGGGSRYEWSTTGDDVIYIEHQDGGYTTPCSTEVEIEPTDAEFIAHARTALPKLAEAYLALVAWANWMPDAGITTDDPRLQWWYERPCAFDYRHKGES